MPEDGGGTARERPATEAERRAERLAQALRANLKRRKDQARGRDATRPQSRDGSANDAA